MSKPHLSITARVAAGLVSLVALVSIGIEFAIQTKESGAATALWSMARYFTYLTNAAVAAILGIAALRGSWSNANLPAASTVWIAVTGIVYHAVLAQTHNPQGIQVLTNIGLHTAAPLGCFTVWILYAPKDGLTFKHSLLWTVWPLLYAIYALLRGRMDGIYPYFFLNPVNSGPETVIAYVIGLGLFFTLCGGILVLLARIPGKSARPTS